MSGLGVDEEDEEMLLGFLEVSEVTERSEKDFNGFYNLKFLYDSGGWGDQKKIRTDLDTKIINYLNKYISEKREREK